MRKLITSLLIAISAVANAQDVLMKDVFASLPDSIFPYLSHNNRLDMIDFVESNMTAEVDNSFGGKSRLDTLTADYLHLTLNETVTVEMKLLPSSRLLDDTTKTVVCLSSTYSAMDSHVRFYTSKWHAVDVPLPSTSVDDAEIAMGIAILSPSSTDIALMPTFPLAEKEEKEKFEAMNIKQILKWNDIKLIFDK